MGSAILFFLCLITLQNTSNAQPQSQNKKPLTLKEAINICAVRARKETDDKIGVKFSNFDAYIKPDGSVEFFGTPKERFSFEKCLASTTSAQTEWIWVIWRKESSIVNGQVEETPQWRAEGIFTEKKVCKEYANAMLDSIGDNWKTSKIEGDEIFYRMDIDASSEDFGQRFTVMKKTVSETGEYWLAIDLICKSKGTTQLSQQKKKSGNK